MIRIYNIRFNKFDLNNRWVVEDSATLDCYPAESVTILVPCFTHNEPDRTLYSIRVTGVLVWEDKKAIIK